MKLSYNIPISIAVFMTVLSQAPLFRERLGIDTQLMILPFWLIALFVILTYNKKIPIGRNRLIFCLFIIILFGITFITLLEFNPKASYYSSLTISIGISLFIFFIGTQSSDLLFDKEKFKFLSYPYVVASIILALDIYLEYFHGYDFTRINYIFKAKNSAGQIMITAIILVLSQLENKKHKIIKLLVIGFLLLEMLLMRSRATLLSTVFIPIVYLGSSTIKRKHKTTIIVLLVLTVLFLTVNENAYNLIINNILLKSNNNISLNNVDFDYISSNRYSIITERIKLISGNELLGLGSDFYVDNLFVNSIGNYGVIIAPFVWLLSILPVIYALKVKRFLSNTDYISKRIIIFQIVSFVYVFNSLFEAWAPFGPGGKCFFLWLLLGMILAKDSGASEGKQMNAYGEKI